MEAKSLLVSVECQMTENALANASKKTFNIKNKRLMLTLKNFEDQALG